MAKEFVWLCKSIFLHTLEIYVGYDWCITQQHSDLILVSRYKICSK